MNWEPPDGDDVQKPSRPKSWRLGQPPIPDPPTPPRPEPDSLRLGQKTPGEHKSNDLPTGWRPISAPTSPQLQPKKMGCGSWLVIGVVLLAVAYGVGSALLDDDEDRSTTAVRPVTTERSLVAEMEDLCGRTLALCGIDFDEFGSASSFTLKPSATNDAAFALVFWGTRTGCLEEVDFARIEQTRALDGMVESANGRSTWTYHPDAGLTVVCAGD